MTQAFRSQFTRIKDLSDRRRLPRLGKIRLGVKAISKKSGKEYPKETSYFVCPPEVQKFYGPTPTELDVMFPLNDIDSIFPQRLAWFGSSKGIKCIGDGERAMRIEEPDGTRYDEMKERDCPCDLYEKGCSRKAHLLVMLPQVNVGGIYQIDVGSYHSIVDINSGVDYIQALVGRFAMVPLKLKRVPRETHGGDGIKQTHYTLMVFFEGDLNFINSLRESTTRILSGPKYALPAPVIENPATDEGAVIEVEEEGADGIPTEEEAIEQLKEKGMVQEEEKPESKIDDANILNQFSKEVSMFTSSKDLNEWYVKNRKEWKQNYSAKIFLEITKLVNDKLEKLKGK